MNETKERKAMSDEEKLAKFKAGKKEAAKKYQENQAKAKKAMNDFLATNDPMISQLPAAVVDAMKYLAGAGKAERVAKPGTNNVLRDMFLERGTIPALELYDKFEYGRPAMEQKIKTFIKAKPEERLWIRFVADTKSYELVGTGEFAPDGWTGYVPVAKTDLD